MIETEPVIAIAHPNIAFIKYWGDRDSTLRLPSNGSISMTLGGLQTKTSVRFVMHQKDDQVILNGEQIGGFNLERIVRHMDFIRQLAGITTAFSIESITNFPVGAGVASSAAGFAALTLAATKAAGLQLGQQELSRIARRGSGSACRSIFGGYVEWHAGEDDPSSFAAPLAESGHWSLFDLIAIVDAQHKRVGSTQGHSAASGSPLQKARVQDAPRRLDICRQAILSRDFMRLAMIAEQDSNMMHAVMQTSSPPILYWQPATIALMKRIAEWRKEGLEVFYTVDAGPNVHCICTTSSANDVELRLRKFPGVASVLKCHPGDAAAILGS